MFSSKNQFALFAEDSINCVLGAQHNNTNQQKKQHTIKKTEILTQFIIQNVHQKCGCFFPLWKFMRCHRRCVFCSATNGIDRYLSAAVFFFIAILLLTWNFKFIQLDPARIDQTYMKSLSRSIPPSDFIPNQTVARQFCNFSNNEKTKKKEKQTWTKYVDCH